VAISARIADEAPSFKRGRSVGAPMRALPGVLALATVVAVLALLVPNALTAGAVGSPSRFAVEGAATTAGPSPATVLKLNSTGTAGYEGGLTPNSSATSLNASWKEPHVNCTVTKNTSVLFDAFLVGSSTGILAGTAVNCTGGIASAIGFYAFITTANTTNVTRVSPATLPVTPGAIVSVTLTHKSGQLKVVLKVGTHSVTKSKASTARVYAVEVGVTGYPAKSGKISSLANFGTVEFGKSYTGVAGTNSATINGTTHGIGGFPFAFELTLVDAKMHPLAVPSALTGSATSFTVTWKRST
jgi:hypothetical protein